MGCGTSRLESPRGSPIKVTGQRDDDVQMVPMQSSQPPSSRPSQAAYYPQASSSQQLSRKHLLQALELVADDLHRNGANLTIVTLGGAVNTIYLRTRQTTEDVDFFAPLGQADARLLNAAMKKAREQSRAPLPRAWLNNQVANFVPKNSNQEMLRKAAIKQNVVILRKPGLTVLVAPWAYMFTAKVDRMFLQRGTQGTKPYDANDAASYLHEYIASHGGRPVKFEQAKEWCKDFGRDVDRKALEQINAVYRELYGKVGVKF